MTLREFAKGKSPGANHLPLFGSASFILPDSPWFGKANTCILEKSLL
jgi:hypothetical protein